MAYVSGEEYVIDLTPEMEASFELFEPVQPPVLEDYLDEPAIDVTVVPHEAPAVIDLTDLQPVDEPKPSVAVNADKTSLGREVLRSGIRVVKMLGSATVLAAGITVALLTAPHIYGLKDSEDRQAVATEQPVPEQPEVVQEPPVTEAPTTTTTAAPEVTTTTIPELHPQPGQKIGNLVFPTNCNYSALITGYRDGQGSAVLDKRVLDETPETECAETTASALQQSADHITRFERVRLPESGGDVSQWEPRAGYFIGVNGEIYGVPCEYGVSIMPGHGSTNSAVWADNVLLEQGDPVIMERADGVVCNYEVIQGQPFDATTEGLQKLVDETVANYGSDYSSFIIMYNCSKPDGTTGDDAVRWATIIGIPRV